MGAGVYLESWAKGYIVDIIKITIPVKAFERDWRRRWPIGVRMGWVSPY